MAAGAKRTHEEFLHRTREVVVARAIELGTIDADEALKLEHAKLLYGIGDGSYRGVCHYEAWENGVGKVDVIEVAATAEESWIQLAGTTAHELGHVLAGHGAGHGSDWKAACEKLGLRRSAAAGQVYRLAQLDRKVREAVYAIAQDLADGSPAFRTIGLGWGGFGGLKITVRPCSAGIGTRGGKSRGTGSGSRMVKVECGECGYVARVSRKWLEEKGAPRCGDEAHGRMVEPEGDNPPAAAAPVEWVGHGPAPEGDSGARFEYVVSGEGFVDGGGIAVRVGRSRRLIDYFENGWRVSMALNPEPGDPGLEGFEDDDRELVGAAR